MRRLVLAMPLLLAGCLGGAPASTQEATFRFVEVRVDFLAPPDPEAACGFPAPPEVDEDARTIAFRGDWPGRDLDALFLTLTHVRACDAATASWATSQRWGGTLQAGDVAYEMREDGALLVDGERVEGTLAWTRSGTLPDGRPWTSATTVVDHGRWPREGLALAP